MLSFAWLQEIINNIWLCPSIDAEAGGDILLFKKVIIFALAALLLMLFSIYMSK